MTRKFNKPCIMDVKIGQKSYDPYASAEKIQQQVSKYPLMEEIGFLVLGMRVRTCFVFTLSVYAQASSPHQVEQLVFLANSNPLEFYINAVLPECLGSAGINHCVKSVPKHCSTSKQLFSLAVSIRASYLQPGHCICVQERGWVFQTEYSCN